MSKYHSVRTRKQSPYESSQWSDSSFPLPLVPRPPSTPRPQTSTIQSRRLQLTRQTGRPRVSVSFVVAACMNIPKWSS